MLNWTFEPLFESYLIVALVAAILIGLLWTRPSFRTLRPSQRRLLIILRLLVVLLIVLAMLRPTYVTSTIRPQTAVLMVMADQSRSMRLPDASGERTRWSAQSATLDAIEPWLAALSEKLEIRLYTFDQQVYPLAFEGGKIQQPQELPNGAQTDLPSSLDDALRRDQGKRLAGMILLSDGTQTAYDPRVEFHELIRQLRGLGYPLYCVGYGPTGDVKQGRDVSIEKLPEYYTVFVKNQLEVRGVLQARGFVNQDLPVRLTIRSPDGTSEVVGPVLVRPDKDGQQLEVKLTYVPREPGQYRLRLEAELQPGELVAQNNSLDAFLTVLDGGLRVLYLEGEPRQEQKFIRWTIDASPDMALDFQWVPTHLRRAWPLQIGDGLQPGDYDVVILGDLDSAALGRENLAALAEMVDAGAGLIMLGGFHSFGPGGYADTPLATVLPIEMNRLARQDFGAPDQLRWHLEGPQRMLPARRHPVMQLGDDQENEVLWQQLAPLRGANRFDRIKEAAGVQVLARSAEELPLLVAGQYGQGRVLAFAGDSTWQWWREGNQKLHKRFWRQLILWLAKRSDLERNDVWVELEQRRFSIGQAVKFSAGVHDASGEPVPNVQLSASLVDPDQQRSELTLTRDQLSFTGRTSVLTQPGNYQIQVQAKRDGEILGDTVGEFQVLDRDVELSNPVADPEQLERLARATQDVGGRLMAAEELPTLLKTIQDNPPKMEEEVVLRWQLTDTWWDAWLMMLALTGLLASEWYLRKKWGLV